MLRCKHIAGVIQLPIYQRDQTMQMYGNWGFRVPGSTGECLTVETPVAVRMLRDLPTSSQRLQAFFGDLSE